MKTNKKNSGFTLVEILIVVVILGILAAIVIPQFSQASTEARENRLRADLQTVRSQIELYKIQHTNDALPGAGTATFVQAMTGSTDINGAVGAGFGPYLQQMPVNPFSATEVIGVSVRIDGAAAGAASDGWRFDTGTGAFQADDSAAHAAW
jgi:general secretion pathway protein G